MKMVSSRFESLKQTRTTQALPPVRHHSHQPNPPPSLHSTQRLTLPLLLLFFCFSGSLKLPTSGTAPSASASAPPKIQVLSSSDINEDDLYRVPEGMENDGEDDYDSDENDDDDDNDEDSDTYYDDFDDEEIEASLALAARTQPTALPTVKSSGSSQKSPAPAARQSAPLPQVVSSSATARPSQQVQRTVIPPSISQAPAPVVSKSKQAQKPNVSAAPKLPSVKKSSNIVVTERDVVAPPLAPALSSQEDVPAAPIVVEEVRSVPVRLAACNAGFSHFIVIIGAKACFPIQADANESRKMKKHKSKTADR